MCINSKNVYIVLAPTRSMATLAQLLAESQPPLRYFACRALSRVGYSKKLTIECLEGNICGRLSGKRFSATLKIVRAPHTCVCDAVFI